jgi:hypothetical protein
VGSIGAGREGAASAIPCPASIIASVVVTARNPKERTEPERDILSHLSRWGKYQQFARAEP